MVRYDQRVLNKLIDTYENSLLAIGENKRNVNIELRFTKKMIPEYFDESSMEYEYIHALMNELEEKDFLSIIWKDGKKNHLIHKVRLNVGKIEKIYEYAKRKPKLGQEAILLEYLDSWLKIRSLEMYSVSVSFANYLQERLENHQSVKEYIDIASLDDVKLLLKAVESVENNLKACYIREFSIENFHDSKCFEQIQGRIGKIFRRFGEGFEDWDVMEILSEYGIYHTPNYVHFKGDIYIQVGQQQPLSISELKQGIGISGDDLKSISFVDLSKIHKVITIENQTTFFRWQESNSLIIYLGGYHNRVRRALLQALHKELPDAEYCHFGDIDAGGFAILKDLRKKTGIPFQTYLMGLDTLKKYEEFGRKLTESDKSRLKEMIDDKEFGEIVRYMLEKDVKLEQECILRGSRHNKREEMYCEGD